VLGRSHRSFSKMLRKIKSLIIVSSLIALLLASFLIFGAMATQASGVSGSRSSGIETVLPVASTHPYIPAPLPVTPSVSVGGITAIGSYNWGGYALNSTAGTVTFVHGNWKVPSVHGTLCSSTAWHASSTWVGIDGVSSGTVEQTGTASDCYEGVLYYFAWYEFYPAGSVQITKLTIHPGDTISANVTYSSGKFIAGIKDVTTGVSFKTAATAVSGAQESSAEWIAESPSGQIGVLELANFYKVTFNQASATISGTRGTIGHFSSIAYSINAIDYPAGSPIKVVVSALSSTGNAFTASWKSQGPYG
jgi:hypothetical protein